MTGTATVYLDQQTGAPQHLASGWIYGIPDTPDQIPDSYYTDVGFRYGRGGGSQLPGTRGWYRSRGDYDARFQSALSNYRTTCKYGGTFVLLPSALWGADGGQPPDALYPGDNDDWSSWDQMIASWIADAKEHNMTESLVFDIWNEPDLKFFWNRPCSQWLQLWSRTYHLLRYENDCVYDDGNQTDTCRRELPTVRVSGPSFSHAPEFEDEWWVEFLTLVKQDGSVPDEWSWHMEQGHGDLSTSIVTFKELLNQHEISYSGIININEYAIWSEQVPSGAVWFISQLERENAVGLRGNWAMAGALHDLLAGLVSKSGAGTTQYSDSSTDYYPAAEYHVYKYYASEMHGQRLRTKSTKEIDGEVYAVLGPDKLRVLAGTRNAKGFWSVILKAGKEMGFKDGTKVDVRVLLFAAKDNHFEACEAPRELELRSLEWRNGELRLEIQQDDPAVAYAFELVMPNTY